MNIQKIKQLVTLVSESNISEIEVKDGETSIRIRSNNYARQVINATSPIKSIYDNGLQGTRSTDGNKKRELEDDTEFKGSNSTNSLPSGSQFKSPMVGTFYASPSPGADPFVIEGKSVKAGDTLCIIEAMKIMNRIEADITGTVLKILVQDGSPVEYDQPIFIIG